MKIIQERLTQAFEKNPTNTAIEYGEKSISYFDLNEKSTRIASAIGKNHKKNSHIGISIEDRLEFIITVVGVLKAGCVFVPLESSFPVKRIINLINSADASLIICNEGLRKQIKAIKEEIEFIDYEELLAYSNAGQLDVEYLEEDPVYIYHTSGSTGQPKTVLGKNISLTHFIAWEINTFPVDESFRFSQLTNVGFDVFLRDTLVALCSGACLCIPEKKEIMLESKSLTEWVNKQRINFIHCVPSVFELINHSYITNGDFKDLRFILLAGEKIRPERLGNWYSAIGDRVQLVNLYGPTETTLAKLFYNITEEDQYKGNISVGKPMDGTQVLILNENMKICDTFETGELYIRTRFRSLGYYNNKELTDQVFIQNPFTNDTADLIYKTGDMGRLLSDGNIELLGRKDRQIKIRGMRIELEEIENTILKNSAIKEAIVIKKDLPETAQLLYAYVTRNTEVADSDDLSQYLMSQLSEELPQYMLPAYIIEIDEVPRLINGKIDYSSLMDPLGDFSKIIAPRDEVESKLVDIWKEVLSIDETSIDDSFFEKGGNSLNLMNLILLINENFGVEINFEQIALENTVERQAEFIKNSTVQTIKKIPAAESKEFYHTLESQKRLYYLQQLKKDNCTYNLTLVALIKGKFDCSHFKDALRQLVKQQENLRTYFKIQDEELMQFILDDVEFEIQEFSLKEDELIEAKVKDLVYAFDLSKAPLFRVFLCKKAEDEFYVVFDFHHIVFDGHSSTIFIENLVEFYNNHFVEELEIQFKDYAEFKNTEEEKAKINEHETFWLEQFEGEIKSLKLPELTTHGKVENYKVGIVTLDINKEKLNKLKECAQQYDTTLFTVLLTGYYVLLSNIGNEEDIVVIIPVNGRGYIELDQVIGMFVNTIALRQYPVHSKTCEELLLEVKNGLLKALENQDFEYNELVHKLNQKKNLNRQQLSDVMFQMQKQKGRKFVLNDVEIETIKCTFEEEFKLNFNIQENVDSLSLTALYKDDMFSKNFICQLVEQYDEILNVFTDYIDRKLSDCIENNDSASEEIEINFDLE